MQPYLFPYIGYWQLISCVDKFVVYDDVNYIVRGWINRNNILVNGTSKLLTLSLSKSSCNKLINEIEIAECTGTKQVFLHQVECNYRKSPQFTHVFPMLESIVLYKENNIARYIMNSLRVISEYLRIRTEFLFSSEIQKNNALRGDDKIAHICEILHADTYVNPCGGMDIYHEIKFSSRNIQLLFLRPKLEKICYRQFEHPFVGGLSIIDILMFNSVDTVCDAMLPQYQLLVKNDE